MTGIIIFALITAFFIVKLYRSLGDTNFDSPTDIATRQPHAQQPSDMVDVTPKENSKEEIERLEKERESKIEQYGLTLFNAIEKIQTSDRNFTDEGFIEGAQGAFETILHAFANGEKDTLKPLVSTEIYAQLEAEIDARAAKKEEHDTTLIAMVSTEIKNIILDKRVAKIVVGFVTDQVNLIKDATGKIIQGNPSQIDRISEEWTFKRSLSSSNPNWVLVETRAAT